MADKLRAFLDRIHSVAAGEAADNLSDQISQGLGVLSAIYFLFHKLSQAKIDTFLNEDLVASLLTYSWSENTTNPIINELVRRKHFFSWYMIHLSGVDPNGLGKRALDEMVKLAHSSDELAIVAKCSHPLLSQRHRDKTTEIIENFFEGFLGQ